MKATRLQKWFDSIHEALHYLCNNRLAVGSVLMVSAHFKGYTGTLCFRKGDDLSAWAEAHQEFLNKANEQRCAVEVNRWERPKVCTREELASI